MHQPTRTSPVPHARAAAGLAAAVVLLGACATTPPAPPTASLNAARQAIATAERSDARQYASAELDEDNQKLGMTNRAVTTENMIASGSPVIRPWN